MRKILTTLFLLSFCLVSKSNNPVKADTLTILENTPQETYIVNARKNRNCYKKGTQIIGLGYGVPSFSKIPFKAIETLHPESKSSGIGPLFLKYEYGISDNISLGLTTRFATSKLVYPITSTGYDNDGNPTAEEVTYDYSNSLTSLGIMVRCNYHFATSRNWDPYVGIGIGYGNTSFDFDLDGDLNGLESELPNLTPLASEITIGTRYFFSEHIGVYAEAGYSQSILNAGLSIKF